eukprot:5654667-Pleurochrysis_carterae.AAC.1
MAPSCHAAVPHGLAWAPSGAATTAADALSKLLHAVPLCSGGALSSALALLRCPAQGSGFERWVNDGLWLGSFSRRVSGRGTLAGEAQHCATAPCGQTH